MKKCNAVCVYSRKNNHVFNFDAVTNDGKVSLLNNRDFDSFKQIYAVAVKIARNNGYLIRSYVDFNALFYQILFVDIDSGDADYYAYPDSLHCD